MVLHFAKSTMRFGTNTQVNGQVRPQLDVVLRKKRRVLGTHSMFRLRRSAPLLHISQQEVGVAYVDGGVIGGVLAGESDVRTDDAAPRSRVILLKHYLAAEVQNVFAPHQGEHIRGNEGVLNEDRVCARTQTERGAGSIDVHRRKHVRVGELQA